MSAKVYVNGSLLSIDQTHISALDRGFALGDGIFETMRSIGERVFRIEDHLARLQTSAAVMGFELPLQNNQFEEAIRETLKANGLDEAVVRLAISRGVPEARGLLPSKSPSVTVVIQTMPFANYPDEKYHCGFTATVSSIRRNESSPASRIKSSNYLDNIFARIESSARGCDEALMLDNAGHLACGTSSNVFLIADGRVTTPPPECGVLAGITRGVVRGLLPNLDLQWDERVTSLEDLLCSDEAFLTNSVMGIGPMVSIDGRPLGSGEPGLITQRIGEAYLSLIAEFRQGN